MENILITGARAPIALELARSFYENGHRVVMADSLRLTVARWSKAVARYYLISSPRFQPDKFIKNIQTIIRDEQITHIIPTCEESFYVANFKHNFDCHVWTADIALMDSLHNKLSFVHILKRYIRVPETLVLSDFNDWANSENYVFKPIYSRFASSVIIGKRITESYFSAEEKKHWIAQKRIQGKEICIYSIWDKGKLKAFSSYHPLLRAGIGAGIFFEGYNNKAVFEAIKTLGAKIHYTGQLSFDAIVDANDDTFFIECNPRGTSGGHLINSRLSNAFLQENALELQEESAFSIKYAILLLKPFRFFEQRVWKSKDVVFQWSDLLPFLLQMLSLVEITFIKFTQNISWLNATTYDIEWNNEHELTPIP